MSNLKCDQRAGDRERPEHPQRIGRLVLLGIAGVSALLIAAFTHLLVVSLESQPECVPHSKAGETVRVGNIAAKSSC